LTRGNEYHIGFNEYPSRNAFFPGNGNYNLGMEKLLLLIDRNEKYDVLSFSVHAYLFLDTFSHCVIAGFPVIMV